MVGDVTPIFSHTPIFFSSVLDNLQNDLCEEWGDRSPPVAPPLSARNI